MTDVRRFDGDILDGAVIDTVTAKQYVHREFRPEYLASEMSVRNFMSMALDLLDEGQFMRNIEKQRMKKVKVVPRTTVHARRISISRSQYTLVLSRELTLGLSCDDAQRLVLAAAPLIKENFPTISKADTKKILKTLSAKLSVHWPTCKFASKFSNTTTTTSRPKPRVIARI